MEHWVDFDVAEVGGAAALVGLLFVAIIICFVATIHSGWALPAEILR